MGGASCLSKFIEYVADPGWRFSSARGRQPIFKEARTFVSMEREVLVLVWEQEFQKVFKCIEP